MTQRFVASAKHAPLITRHLFDAIPGILILLMIAFCLVAAWWLPHILVALAAGLSVYVLIRFILVALASVRGLQRIRQWEAVDWSQYPVNDATHHLVIIPNYNEPLNILHRTLDRLALSQEAQRMTVVLAMEAAEPHAVDKAKQLQAAYKGMFAHLVYTLHPAGLPGEMQCKSANQAWAARWAKHYLVNEHGYPLDYIIVTTMDADTLWHPDYFTALAVQFNRDPARHHTFWQAPIRYHANIYDVNPVTRSMNVYTTATELGYLRATWWQSLPISSYSLSLSLLHDADYWDTDVIADEWHMYIKAFFATGGQVKLQPIYLPFLAYIVTGDTLLDAFRNRYKQTLRHAWGSQEIGYALGQMLRQPASNPWRSWMLLLAVAHDLLLSSVGWVLLTVGSQLPFLLHSDMRASLLANPLDYAPFVIMQLVNVVLFVLGLLLLWLDIRTRPPRPQPATHRENLLSLIGFALLPIFGILFVILPMFHAQFQLLFSKKLAFRVTAKT